MYDILRFDGAVPRSPDVEAWLDACPPSFAPLARCWFAAMRNCGDDVRELVHDGRPTACVGDVPFAYVDVFTAHAAVGFFRGALLPDPARLLEGQGKRMRHVKLRAGRTIDDDALRALVQAACDDARRFA